MDASKESIMRDRKRHLKQQLAAAEARNDWPTMRTCLRQLDNLIKAEKNRERARKPANGTQESLV